MHSIRPASRRPGARVSAAVLLLALCLLAAGAQATVAIPINTTEPVPGAEGAANATATLVAVQLQPYPGPHPVPGTVQAEDFDLGGEGVAYHDTEPQNLGGAYRPNEGVDIETVGGITNVGWVRAGEWLSYTVNASAPQTVVLRLRAANPDTVSKQVAIQSDEFFGTIEVPPTGSFTTYTTVNSTPAFLPEGEATFRLFFSSGRINLDRFEIVRVVEPAPVEGPPIDWQRLLGGSGNDGVFEGSSTIDRTADGGYVLIGESTSSASGDVAGTNHGINDVWLVKLDAAGAIEWQRLYGGSQDDYGMAVQQTEDGGYILLGFSFSSQSGDVNATSHGAADLWVVKVDPAGVIQWQRLLGGDQGDAGRDVRQTSDGGFVLLGTSMSSASGDVTGANHGVVDLWVVKLNATGAVEWDRLLGGAGFEDGWSVRRTDDGGYFLVGSSGSSQSGDVTGTNHGVVDVWTVKLDAAGATQWQRLYGGSRAEYGWSGQQTANGGYVVLGASASSQSGDVTGTNHDGGMSGDNTTADYWVVTLDAAGAIVWQELLGGAGSDDGRSIEQTADSGFILVGDSFSSAGGDITGTRHGSWDIWAVRLDGAGAVRWQRLFGGRGSDTAGSVIATPDGGYVFTGTSTSSANGDVAGTNHGGDDIWVVKLAAEAIGVKKVPGGVGVPTDPNGDGRFEDVNGNGVVDFNDLILFFYQMDWIIANEPLAAFDYNQNGTIDFADIIWLFEHMDTVPPGQDYTVMASAIGPGEIVPAGNVTVREGENVTFTLINRGVLPTPHDTQSGYVVNNEIVVDPSAVPTPYPSVMPYGGSFTPSYTLVDVRANHTVYALFYYVQIIA